VIYQHISLLKFLILDIIFLFSMFSLNYTLIGFIIIAIGIFLIILSAIYFMGSGGESAGFILIGPIPIVFGTSKRFMKYLIPIAILLIALYLIFLFYPYIFSHTSSKILKLI